MTLADFARSRFYNRQDSFSQHERALLDEDIFKQMSKAAADTVKQTACRDAREQNSPRSWIASLR